MEFIRLQGNPLDHIQATLLSVMPDGVHGDAGFLPRVRNVRAIL